MPKPYRFNDNFDQDSCPLHCQDPVDILEPLEIPKRDQLFAEMADLLEPVLLFMANGKRYGQGSRRKDTSAVRLWVVLYVIRPDLAKDSVETYAKRVGVHHTQVWNLIAELRRSIPRFTYGRSSRAGSVLRDKPNSLESTNESAIFARSKSTTPTPSPR